MPIDSQNVLVNNILIRNVLGVSANRFARYGSIDNPVTVPRERGNMATIFDIADKAGVSITTVSRALNGYSDVNEKTRQRIIAIAEELKYYPSAAARHLQGKRTNTI